MVRSRNVVVDACRRGLRTTCALALLAACTHICAAQEYGFEYGMPPEAEAYFGEEESIISDVPEGVIQPDMLGSPGGVVEGPMVDYYYPNGAAEAGMPVAMPGIMPGDNEAPWHRSFGPPEAPPPPCMRCWSRLGFRHSSTHGRSVGWGQPNRGTSWLNRPYYVGASLGPMWLTREPIPGVERDKDVIGAIYFGWDWDYYWGSEFQYSYATPELRNRYAVGQPKSDRLAHWDYSFMYYPWGDSKIRPYWRFGIGNTKFDVPFADGRRRDEWVLSTPWGIGIKYPIKRWLAVRMEFNDQLSWGNQAIATQHNLTLNFGFEFHYGGHRTSYWPWNPNNEFW